MIHRYKLRTDPDMSGKLRGMIGNIKYGEWCKYEDVKELEEINSELLEQVNTLTKTMISLQAKVNYHNL